MNKILIAFTLFTTVIFVKAQNFNGFALYNPQGQTTTYLIDENENIAHTWNMNTECNYTVALKENGNLVRGTKNNGNQLSGAADAGRVQEIDPQGNIVWDYIYSTANYLSHHDLTLVGDNVLITAWEVKTSIEVNNMGYDNATSDKWPTHFVELADDGNGGANIVWEWHIWDHMIQDTDASKPNYGVISDNPQLIDINMIQGGGGDWFHVNGVDYNEDLDQIVFSSRFASEIYIIDHSTTTAEAASHSGGNSGMGGDIMYRWGNPSNYNMSGAQIIDNAVHDARWITDDGRPNGGFLQIFNNSGVSNNQSAIDGIQTPWDATTSTYLRTPGQAFGPASYTTRYACAYSASGQSASDRMSNGNIFVNASSGQGGAGVMYEVDSLGTIIWGPYNAQSQKGFRYECDYPGIIALEQYMISTATTSCFTVSSIGNEITSGQISIYPNPTKNVVTIKFESVELQNIDIRIINSIGQNVYSNYLNNYMGSVNEKVDLSFFSEGLYFVKITTDKGQSVTERIARIK
ncbi:MAG: aryl-sulfate sulfotransferase [Flavobacteriales bacterium]|nr:aryl-sulfate sulfotransferase [Flavobacteriales bacterium]